MALRYLLIIVLLFSFKIGKALESQIILIQSEAYLVTLDENYDVVTVIERVPDYFQDHSTHEEILAEQLEQSNNESYGCNDMLLDRSDEVIHSLTSNYMTYYSYDIAISKMSSSMALSNSHRVDPRYARLKGRSYTSV